MEKYNSLQQFTFLPNPDPLKLQLGQGSYGVVKLAKCNKTNEKFALKIVIFKIDFL